MSTDDEEPEDSQVEEISRCRSHTSVQCSLEDMRNSSGRTLCLAAFHLPIYALTASEAHA